MANTIISIGNILRETTSETRYRVVALVNEIMVLCKMEISRFQLFEFEGKVLIGLVLDEKLIIENDDNSFVFDTNVLADNAKKNYQKKLCIMNEVTKAYAPTYMGLCGKKPKPELKSILEKYNYPNSSFWRTCVTYFQSGMRNVSLVDEKCFGLNKGKAYQYENKPGKKSGYLIGNGIYMSDEIRSLFDEALNDYKFGRQKTLKAAYARLNAIHFSKTEIIDGKAAYVLKPAFERPTMVQFYYYAKKQITNQEKDLIKTSAMEQRNNKRLITSDSLNGVYGPADMVEIDACEADVSLVSTFNANQTVGRPIVYFMVDVYTRIILAVSVAFDNNSVLGVTNLFLNLADDKHEYCAKYGIGFDNNRIWPSSIIPRRLRVDRGSEFVSKEFDRICVELGIEKQIVPGGSGSLKGIVEQSFHQMHSMQNVHLENHGLIEKRYDSNHHKEATLNIEQYTKMVIAFVLSHNQKYDGNYPSTREMVEKKVKAIPVLLWEYGVQKYGSPRPITAKEQYLYTLMTPIKAKVSRRGISYRNLWYLEWNDKTLLVEMFNAGSKKFPFEARMDMRDVGAIYYIRNGQMVTASLNNALTGNADFTGMTMKEYEDFRKVKRQLNAEGNTYNEEIASFSYAVDASIVGEAKKPTMSNNKGLRAARETEKQAISNGGNISQRLPSIQKQICAVEEAPQIPNVEAAVEDTDAKNKKVLALEYQSWEEALEDLWENS